MSAIYPPKMRGSDGVNPGSGGLVPKPAATDNTKFLRGDGTFAATTSASAATNAQADAGTDTSLYVTPSALKYATGQKFASRQGADYIYSDGATSNRRIETQYGAVGAVAGSDLTEVDYVFDVPTSNPSTRAYIWAWSSSTGDPIFSDYSLLCYINTTGGLVISQRGTPGGSVGRDFTYPSFRATYSARRVRLTVALLGDGLTNPTVWLDGVDVSASFTLSVTGSPPNWMTASLGTTYHYSGFTWPAGYFRPGRPVNRKYAQSDVDFVQVAGRLPYQDMAGGTMVSGVPGAMGFSYGATDANVSTNQNASGTTITTTAGTRTGGAGSYYVNVAQVSTTGGRTAGFSGMTHANINSIGAQVLVSFWAKSATGMPGLGLGVSMQNPFGGGAASATTTIVPTTSWAQYTTILTITATGGSWVQFSFASAGGTVGDNFDIDDLQIIPLGALSDPIIQPCLVLDDATPNNRAALLVGFTHVTTKKDWRIPAFVDMSSTGNKQLLGGAVFNDPTTQVIDTIEDNVAGTPTYSVGDGTTATKYTASTARTAGRSRLSLSTNFPADSGKTGIYANVTVSSASDTAALIVVRGHKE